MNENKDLFDLCRMNLLDEKVDDPQLKEVLRQKIEKQAKIIVVNTEEAALQEKKG